MNILLLDEAEIDSLLPNNDERVRHIRRVLKKGKGDCLVAGIVGGSIGVAKIEYLGDDGMRLSFTKERESDPLYPLRLIVGFPRPIQLNRLLKELCCLGVESISLCGTDLGEKSYLKSSMLEEEGFRRSLVEGASQAGSTLLSKVEWHWTLDRALGEIEHGGAGASGAVGSRFAMDNVEPEGAFSSVTVGGPLSIAIGSERGWSARERELLRAHGFSLRSLGSRILRTETACIAATVIGLEKLGLI